jgi:raffinose/stachyose/melibiose transport system substrate-binding protein
MRTSRALLSFVLVCCLAFLAACGGNNSSGSTSDNGGKTAAGSGNQSSGSQGGSAPSGESVTISFWGLDDQMAYLGPIIDEFQQENPNITVEVSTFNTDPIKESLKVAASSRTLPDIWFNWGGSFASFYSANGLAMDLTQVAADHNWESVYNPAALELARYEGKIYMVPFHLASLGVFVKKDLYDKYGFSAPATLAELENHMAKMAEDGITPLPVGGKGGWMLMRWTEQLIEHYAGPELHDQLNALEASWENEAVVKALAKLKEWNDKGWFTKGFITMAPEEAEMYMYSEGGYALEGTWFDQTLSSNGYDPNNYLFFKFPNEQGVMRMSSFVEGFQISAETTPEKQEAAIKLAEYMTSPDVVSRYINQYGAPALIEFAATEAAPHVKLMAEEVSAGNFLITDQALPQEVVDKLFEVTDAVILNAMTPEQAAAEMQKAVDQYKANN